MTIIETKLGSIQGLYVEGVSSFLGIPYAAPPVDHLRWKPPGTAPGWTGTFNAMSHPNRALQPPYGEALDFGPIPGEQSEDCLYLNIYTPAADGKKRPVMFWIHGGAYMQGSANEYDGTILARENDVVVVAINYRLGILGFLDLSRFGPEYIGSGSLAFQDQIAALGWVRDNIDDFGGDPGNVTIWGESAGGGSVLALLAAPSAEGLFHKAIAFSPGEVSKTPMDNISQLTAKLDVEEDEILNRLRESSAEELHQLQLEGSFTTNACVDGSIITRSSVDAILERGSSGVPLITGCNKDEGSFLAAMVNTGPGSLEMLTSIFAVNITDGQPDAYLTFLDEHMPGATALERMDRAWYDLFRASSLRAAQATSQAGAGGWIYNFNVPTDNPLGVTHASEIPFTFNAYKNEGPMFGFHDGNDPVIRDLADKWSTTFTEFARTGDPNGGGLPSWPVYEESARSCLVVDLTPRVEQNPDGDMLEIYGLG